MNVTINQAKTKRKGNEIMEEEELEEKARELNNQHFRKMIGNYELMGDMNNVRNTISSYIGWACDHLAPEDLDIFGENGELLTKANALRLAIDDFISYAGKISNETPELATELGDGWENYVDFQDYCINHHCLTCPLHTMSLQKGKNCEECYFDDLD